MNNKTLVENLRTIHDWPIKGIEFRDVTTLFKNPTCMRIICDETYDLYKDKGITKIVGIESRGFILGMPMAYKMGIGFVPVRKPNKLPAATYSQEYSLEYGTDKKVNGVIINEKCKSLAKKVKEIIDIKSSFADWLNNQNVRNQLKLDIKICLVKNGYPPQYSPEVFNKVMKQVENFEKYADITT